MSEVLKIKNRAEENLQKIEVNSYGDLVYINANDAGIFDRYADFLKWLEEKDAEVEKKRAENAHFRGVVRFDVLHMRKHIFNNVLTVAFCPQKFLKIH